MEYSHNGKPFNVSGNDTKHQLMRVLSILFLIIFSTKANSQIDSSWLADKYLPKFYKDTGTYLQTASFVDEEGREKKLSDFKGKILYVDVWSTSCAPCIAMFPYQEQLLKRLKAIHLDSAVHFININTEDSKSKWKKAIRKYHPIGINLFSTDTTLYTRWNIDALPCYILLDTLGKVLGKCISGPDDAAIDWILYSATKAVQPVEAIWRWHTQEKLRVKHHSSFAFTDQEYAQWYKSIFPALLEFSKWRRRHQGF